MTDYTNIVNDLRGINDTMFAISTSNINIDKISIRMAFDKNWHNIAEQAADAIEALQAELPKRGEWKATEMYMTDECTACGFLMNWEDVPEFLFNLPHFKDNCPNCGAKMEVQDG